ncbi:hypothetical protein KFK09_008499 [Dendrobium nobile]|uniref:Glycosyl transferase family 1 domain-containing protein n=1 Tax=Dendrobium nobile TaxID=94219 RepID=A0A8T3BKV5_DENNO|nr:hypothetical protein KFK09_008499 [Dendrobium nobile]
MGSMETGVPLKRASVIRSPPLAAGRSFFQRPRSRLARFLLFEKVDYLQWICTAAAFFFVVILFQAFLPGSISEKFPSRRSFDVDRGVVKSSFRELEFGDGIRFVPAKLLERFEREKKEVDSFLVASGRPMRRAGLRKPRLALVVGGLSPDAMQLQMVSIAAALKELGYDIEVFSFYDGSVHAVWRAIGIKVNILPVDMKQGFTIDWLDYSGVLVSAIQARLVISCLLQEPFKSIPVIWIIQDQSLAVRLSYDAKNGHSGILNQWKQVFSRTNVVVFTNYLLPIIFSAFDAGNYFVIPSSVPEAWMADNFLAVHNQSNLRINTNYSSEDFLIVLVGSQFEYSGKWLEQALVLQGLTQLQNEFRFKNYSYPILKIGLLSGNSSNTYKMSLETIALNFGFPRGLVQQIGGSVDDCSFLGITDLVIYASFHEEQSFPPVLLQAMSLGKLVVAPDLDMINKYIVDGVNGFLYPKDNVGKLMRILQGAISKGELSPLAKQIASLGQRQSRNLMVSETIQGYSWLLENIIKFPSEISLPKAIGEIPSKMKEEWQWHLFANLSDMGNLNETNRKYGFFDKLVEWNQTDMEADTNTNSRLNESFSSINWEEEKRIETANARKRLEEEELKYRTDQPRGTWEEVYRSAKRADRAKNELHESDEKELERTGQPLCIYEPYFGEGTWPFLHNISLYRGIGLLSKGQRPGAYDIDAISRLPLLGNSYYRDTLGEFGAFLALANRIDRIHKNAWIGFQSWRVGARKESLSKKAEKALLESIEAQKHGDALYFWVRMDKDPRNPLQQGFWSFCDAINAGNCRFTVSKALQQMYGVKHDLDALPPMPKTGGTWSVMHSWALPTRSFLEFVMFSRMFIDALDAQMYEQHHQSSLCLLNLGKDRHCYSRMLELLINVWAYHSARQIIYVNPETGAMHEQHQLKRRRGKMWIKWFLFSTLKSMDEDLAEESDDSDRPNRRWLWPSTGEVFWQGIYDRERSIRHHQKEKRKQQSKEKIRRIRSRTRQKSLGKYIKPPPEAIAEPARGN